MNNKIIEISFKNNEDISTKLITKYLNEKKIIYLKNQFMLKEEFLQKINYSGPAIILNSSGSKNKPKKCIHSTKNLDMAAENLGVWLKNQAFILENCFIFNTLPLYHISGFMSFWRSKNWNCEYLNIPKELFKNPKDLFMKTNDLYNPKKYHFITSMVPTQLYKLSEDSYGMQWLKLFDLIWIGGAAITKDLVNKCIDENINLSPCYGTTETAAMITALKPSEFLRGNFSSGSILNDINIRINKAGIIEVKTDRIGLEVNKDSEICDFKNQDGWWESGDFGNIYEKDRNQYLEVLGRTDNSLNSGGEIIFTELIKRKIYDFAKKIELTLELIEINAVKDFTWGDRFEVMIYFKNNINKKHIKIKLENLAKTWPHHERPIKWILINASRLKSQNKIDNWKNII